MMPIPDFIVDIRRKIGHDLLWLPGVTAVVFDADGRVLLVRRADNDKWSLVSGCLEPGEQPAVGLVREIAEETGVIAETVRLIGIEATEPGVCPNGDKVQWLDTSFVCRAIGGHARVNDDESVDVGWFYPDALPQPLHRHQAAVLARARRQDSTPWFVTADVPKVG